MTLRRTALSAILAPYQVALYPFLAIRRAAAELRLRGEWRSWVTPSLLVGGFLVPGDVGELHASGVRAVVNVSRELVDPRAALSAAGIAYMRVPCWDMRSPSLHDAARGVDFIDAHIGAGGKVYVHCASGVGRSVSLALCYLAACEGADVDEALDRISRLRPRVAMRGGQRAFVERYVRWHRARGPRF